MLKRRSDRALELEEAQRFRIILRSARLAGTALRGSRFRGAHIWHADMSHVYAERTDFSHAALDHCDLRNGRFVGCNFVLSRLFFSELSNSKFRGANFERADLHFVNLSGSDLSGSRLTKSSLSAVDLRGSDLHLADLSGARIRPGRSVLPDGDIDNKEEFCLLTQAQLDGAAADPAKPPEVDPGTLDVESGKTLAWNKERGAVNWERLMILKEKCRTAALE